MTGAAAGAEAAAGPMRDPAQRRPDSLLAAGTLRTLLACLLGAGFATSLTPLTALGYAQGRMMAELGWTAADIRLAVSTLLWSGAISIWTLGWITDRLGA